MSNITQHEQGWYRWFGKAFIVLMLCISPLHADLDHNEIKALRDAGKILPLLTILQIHRQHYQGGRVLEAELERERDRYVYDLKVLHNDGVVFEVEYDAVTGELYEIEREEYQAENNLESHQGTESDSGYSESEDDNDAGDADSDDGDDSESSDNDGDGNDD